MVTGTTVELPGQVERHLGVVDELGALADHDLPRGLVTDPVPPPDLAVADAGHVLTEHRSRRRRFGVD
jgi:hypothetical protein